MTIYRIPRFGEKVRVVMAHRPYEGTVWILESEDGGSIARSIISDFSKIIDKYNLSLLKPCSNPSHWDEAQYFCQLCATERSTT